MPKIKIVEDDLPDVYRYAALRTDSVDRRHGTNNTRITNGKVERLPSRTTAYAAPDDNCDPFTISDRADSWWVMALSMAGNIAPYILTTSRAVLGGRNAWEMTDYEKFRRYKMFRTGTIEWTGKCLLDLIAAQQVDPAWLLTRDDLPSTPCEPNADNPCACKVAEQKTRRARHEAAAHVIEEEHRQKLAANEIELAERSARAVANALAPTLEKLAAQAETPRRARKE